VFRTLGDEKELIDELDVQVGAGDVGDGLFESVGFDDENDDGVPVSYVDCEGGTVVLVDTV
jgi:hypothetical protein